MPPFLLQLASAYETSAYDELDALLAHLGLDPAAVYARPTGREPRLATEAAARAAAAALDTSSASGAAALPLSALLDLPRETPVSDDPFVVAELPSVACAEALATRMVMLMGAWELWATAEGSLHALVHATGHAARARSRARLVDGGAVNKASLTGAVPGASWRFYVVSYANRLSQRSGDAVRRHFFRGASICEHGSSGGGSDNVQATRVPLLTALQEQEQQERVGVLGEYASGPVVLSDTECGATFCVILDCGPPPASLARDARVSGVDAAAAIGNGGRVVGSKGRCVRASDTVDDVTFPSCSHCAPNCVSSSSAARSCCCRAGHLEDCSISTMCYLSATDAATLSPTPGPPPECVSGRVKPLRRAYFGVALKTPTHRSAWLARLALSTRPFLGPTSLDPQLALLMCSLARVRKGSILMDPFIGTGSIVLAGASFGAATCGSDIDARVLGGKLGRNIATNFDAYSLGACDVSLADSGALPLRFVTGGWVDAIVCDPPYGVRAGVRRGGDDATNAANATATAAPTPLASDNGVVGFVVPRVVLDPEELIHAFLDTAASVLIPSGRLVFLHPATPDMTLSALPTHPLLSLSSVGEDVLSPVLTRLIVTMERTSEPYDPACRSGYRRAQMDAAARAAAEGGGGAGSVRERMSALLDAWYTAHKGSGPAIAGALLRSRGHKVVEGAEGTAPGFKGITPHAMARPVGDAPGAKGPGGQREWDRLMQGDGSEAGGAATLAEGEEEAGEGGAAAGAPISSRRALKLVRRRLYNQERRSARRAAAAAGGGGTQEGGGEEGGAVAAHVADADAPPPVQRPPRAERRAARVAAAQADVAMGKAIKIGCVPFGPGL